MISKTLYILDQGNYSSSESENEDDNPEEPVTFEELKKADIHLNKKRQTANSLRQGK